MMFLFELCLSFAAMYIVFGWKVIWGGFRRMRGKRELCAR